MAPIPAAVFLEATRALKEACVKDDTKAQAFYRRIAIITLSGGIPVHFLDSFNGFKFQSRHFESIGLIFDHDEKITASSPSSELLQLSFSCLREHAAKKNFSEAGLRVIFWDSLVSSFFMEVGSPWEICSELNLKAMLKLVSERRCDMSIVASKFNLPALIVEVGKDSISSSFDHKDMTKLSTLMAISCIRMAERLRDCGVDPAISRSFGLLIGGDSVQFAVCHPVFERTKNGRRAIFASVSMHEHWFCTFKQTWDGAPGCSLSCCSTQNIIHPLETMPMIASSYASITDELDLDEIDMQEPKKDSYFGKDLSDESILKLQSFSFYVKKYIKFIDSVIPDANVPKQDLDFDSPNVSQAPCSSSGTDGLTPLKKRVKMVEQSSLAGVKSLSIIKNGQLELKLYTEHFADLFFYPRLFSYELLPEDSKQVKYTFEKMIPILGNGILGPYGSGKCFAPNVIREEQTDCLILDAVTLAIHVLYGIYVLHEKIGYVHGDISSNNIMFSPLDRIWKLNDFGNSLPVEESLKTVRNSGTKGFISPETLETGIYDKSSDVYALGRVLWNSFHLQIAYLLEMEDYSQETLQFYESFVRIVHKMMFPDPLLRLSVLDALRLFNNLLWENELENFEIYGSSTLMINVDNLLKKHKVVGNEPDKSDDIPMNTINC